MRTIIPGLLGTLLALGPLPSCANEPELMAIVPDHVGLTVQKSPMAIVPDHVGLTVQKSPVLYFYVFKVTSDLIHFTLIDGRNVQPMAEFFLQSPTRPGFLDIRLEDHQIVLEEEVQYRWYVSVSRSPNPLGYPHHIVAEGMIARVNPRDVGYYGHGCDQDSVLQAEKAGLWIDAFACVNELLKANPDAEALGQLRERLWRRAEIVPSEEVPAPPLARRPGCPPLCEP